MPRFTDHAFLITGATSGIGRATARLLTDEGARVLGTGHDESHLDEARGDVPDVEFIANDAADPDCATDLANAAREFAPAGLDDVFLNAGIGTFAGMADLSLDELERLYAVDLRAPFLQSRALGPCLKDGGKMLLIGSGSVGGGRTDLAAYSMMKAGVRQLVRSLATHYASRGICVNAVTPGATATGFHEKGGMSDDEIEKYHAKMAEAIPLGRMGEPGDVARAAAFLLSDHADYITGTELRVDGGLTMA
ncbi:SDR family NAD(P)-dependent oxidoreductase [Aurantiacibacter spongiae]|uniref:SDR family oxidoreductase n=1 Tax=Aurantiacibacter spongiae TaxID=2488860 RepID=A0A3N5DQ56_9SPHN|nr:SDR family oxidoreductase [Aurantiacibacter spongiae]RPF71291.1 SDR family oxidoreductase [Aurantiacibacter spongiae]